MRPYRRIPEARRENLAASSIREPNYEYLLIDNLSISNQPNIGSSNRNMYDSASSNEFFSSEPSQDRRYLPNTYSQGNPNTQDDWRIQLNKRSWLHVLRYRQGRYSRSEQSNRRQVQSQDDEWYKRFLSEQQEQLEGFFEQKEFILTELITDKNLVYDPKPGFSRFNPNNLYCIQSSASANGYFYFDNPQQFQHLQPYHSIAPITQPKGNQINLKQLKFQQIINQPQKIVISCESSNERADQFARLHTKIQQIQSPRSYFS